MIRTLYHCSHTLASTTALQSKEDKHIHSALKGNGYPRRFIHRIANQVQSQLPFVKTEQSYQNTIQETKPTAVITLPYLQGLLEAIRQILGEYKIEVRFKPHTTLRQILVKPKDPTSRKDVVYSIPCADCNKCYIGQSGRSLSCRKNIKELL